MTRPRHSLIRLSATLLLTLGTLASAAEEPGRKLYLERCAGCHQRDGRGIDGVFPALRDADRLWEDRGRTIRLLLTGRLPELGRNAPRMPTHGYLGNETIASVLTFLLDTWGPGGEPFAPDEVAEQRLALMARHPNRYPALPDDSPLAELPAGELVFAEGPAMSVKEFEEARALYYGRCTGCHGVLRQGTAGTPLTPELMRTRGTEYLQAIINYGSSTGMPNWGTGDSLTAEQINLLARYLQHPVPQPPEMDAGDVRATWQLYVPPDARPPSPRHGLDVDDLFVALLHDVAQVAIVHGPSRRVVATVPTGRGPHRLKTSASGRYLYVVCRDGTVSQVDLFADPPVRVAEVRIGFEARALGASRYAGYEDQFVLAGAYWPPQLVLLNGLTLEPLRVISTRAFTAGRAGPDGYHPEPRVSDVTGSSRHAEFIAHIKETGRIYLVPHDATTPLQVVDIATTPELRAGSFALGGRYHLTPADANAVVVLDSETRRLAAEVPARVYGAGPGVGFVDPQHGPVWLTATMVSSEVTVIGTDPVDHPQAAWRVVRTLTLPGTGSLFAAAHPRSNHVYLDAPLSVEPDVSRALFVWRRDRLAAPPRRVPVADLAGLPSGPGRVLQPTFDATGREVWAVVWNPQDERSALVVLDDRTHDVLATITDPRLVTPTRLYSLARVQARLQAR